MIETVIYANIGLLILRIAAAIIFIYQAIPKITDTKLTAKNMNKPASGILMLGLLEVAASLSLLTGILIQFSAGILAVIVIGSFLDKLFIRRFDLKNNGWELDLLMLSALIAIFLSGGGDVDIFYLVSLN